MAIKYEYTYEVDGKRNFPIDMLRYDRAIPATEVDSNIIAHTLNPSIIQVGVNTVKVRSEKAPTEMRWRSFGWTVQPNTIAKRRVS